MGRPCTICSHERRAEIDAALVSGESYRNIAQRFGVSPDALGRHKKQGHIVKHAVKAAEVREIESAATLLDQVRDLQETALRVLHTAEQQDDLRAANGALREVRGILELQAKITGELGADQVVNVNLVKEQNVQFQTIVLEVMCDACRERVAGRLREIVG